MCVGEADGRWELAAAMLAYESCVGWWDGCDEGGGAFFNSSTAFARAFADSAKDVMCSADVATVLIAGFISLSVLVRVSVVEDRFCVLFFSAVAMPSSCCVCFVWSAADVETMFLIWFVR